MFIADYAHMLEDRFSAGSAVLILQGAMLSSPSYWLPRKIASILANKGYYVALHSTSMLVMHDDMYVASIHVYPIDQICVVKLYKYNKRVALYRAQLLSLLEKLCAKVEHGLVPVED